MADSRVAPIKEFALEDARRVLPLVRAIVADLVELQGRVSDRALRLDCLVSGRDLKEGDPYADELSQMQRDVQADKLRLQEYITELRELGVVPDKAQPGVVKFPSHREGQPVWLCWRLGSEDVEHWCPRGDEKAKWVSLRVPEQPGPASRPFEENGPT